MKMCFIHANCGKQYLQKKLLSALLYFSVTKSGASESRYDLTKPGTPLIDLGSQVVSIEPKEKSFHKIFHLPNPFSLDVWWLALDLCSWNKDDPIVDMSCHARISGPLGKFYSISIPFQFFAQVKSSLSSKNKNICYLCAELFSSGKWKTVEFIHPRRKRRKDSRPQNNGDIRFNGTKHDDAEQNGIKDENTQNCRQGDVLRKEC